MKICGALDASDGFLHASGVLWEALGSFDVKMVCPLPGSCINHVFLLRKMTLYFRKAHTSDYVAAAVFCFLQKKMSLDFWDNMG